MPADDTLLPLAEAALLIPGADADTLKRRARAGKLTVYRPGKMLLTTPADVRKMVVACRVEPKARGCGFVQPATTEPRPSGLSSTDPASAVLDAALTNLRGLKRR